MFEKLKETEIRDEAEMLHRAAAYCSIAERCIYDVRKKIASAGLSPESEERIIARLIEEKFIDEARFCRCFVSDKSRFNEWGRIKMSGALRRKGIAQSLIDEALSRIDEDDYRRILTELLIRKKRTVRSVSDTDLFVKLCRFAVNKGYEQSLVVQCVKKLCQGGRFDDDDLE